MKLSKRMYVVDDSRIMKLIQLLSIWRWPVFFITVVITNIWDNHSSYLMVNSFFGETHHKQALD